MFCDLCKKRKASVHLTEILNEEVTELHLCEECAKAKDTQMQQHFSVADLLSGLVDFPFESTTSKAHTRIKCPSCGMSYSDFKKMGRFGCADCYEAFKRALYPLLKKIHTTTRHTGKQPIYAAKKHKKEQKGPTQRPRQRMSELRVLKARLAKAITLEEFEEAAVLRDRVKALEDKSK